MGMSSSTATPEGPFVQPVIVIPMWSRRFRTRLQKWFACAGRTTTTATCRYSPKSSIKLFLFPRQHGRTLQIVAPRQWKRRLNLRCTQPVAKSSLLSLTVFTEGHLVHFRWPPQELRNVWVSSDRHSTLYTFPIRMSFAIPSMQQTAAMEVLHKVHLTGSRSACSRPPLRRRKSRQLWLRQCKAKVATYRRQKIFSRACVVSVTRTAFF